MVSRGEEFALPACNMTFQRVTELLLTTAEREQEPDAVAGRLLGIAVARLGWQGFDAIQSLDALTGIRDLYLQYNNIRRIENLEFHSKLSFLALGNNCIAKVENLSHLRGLKVLDLSSNAIEHLDADELPQSLRNVDFSGNPCAAAQGYGEQLIARLPALRVLDNERLRASEGQSQKQDRDRDRDRDQDQDQDQERDEEGKEGRVELHVPRLPPVQQQRPSSAVHRSDALMDAALAKIEQLSSQTRARAKCSSSKHRIGIADRSRLRKQELDAAHAARMMHSSTRPASARPDATNQGSNS